MDAVARPEDRRGFIFSLLVAVVLLPAALGSSAEIFNDGDVSWHIATGQWILDHRAIPHVDPFSFTWAGKPWVPIEWLAEVIMAGVYRASGYSGIAALVTAALMALHAIVFFNARRFIPSIAALGILVAMDAVLIPMMLARPHLLAWPLVAGWTWLMIRAREQERAPPLAAALIMVVWANLHGSFAIGMVIAATFGLEALIESADKRTALRQWLIFGFASLAGIFLNANGVNGVFHPLHIASLKMLPFIQEWKPSDPKVTPFFFAVLGCALAAIGWFKPRIGIVRVALLIALLGMALWQVRHQSVLAIVAATVLPASFASRSRRQPVSAREFQWILGGTAAILVGVRAVMPIQLMDNASNPWKLIAAVPPELRRQPVLNGYSMGGPLILSGIRPYVDGRGDMYGDQLVINYKHITDGDPQAFAEAVRRWEIRWAIFPNSAAKFISMIDRTPGWRRIHKDSTGVIYVRD